MVEQTSNNNRHRKNVLELMRVKQQIEDEIQAQWDILKQNGIGMEEPLVDREGFPLATCDVYKVRHARNRIICLQNDHTGVMRRIEGGLGGYYGGAGRPTATQMLAADAPTTTTTAAVDDDNNSAGDNDCVIETVVPTVPYVPIAKITEVTPGSPADGAGWLAGDLIVQFGSVNVGNFTGLTDIASVVQHSEDVTVTVILERAGIAVIQRDIVPHRWCGRGLIGANINVLPPA